MTNQNPIEPLPSRELIIDLWAKALQRESSSTSAKEVFATLLAQWGFNQHAALNEAELQKARDEELEACCEEMKSIPSPLGIPFGEMASNALRAARRPKPKSLAEQKQAIHGEIHQLLAQISANNAGALAVAEPIRRALERLRELEEGSQ